MSKYLDNDIQKKKSPKRLRLPAEPFRAALGDGWRITLGIGGKYASQQGKILKVEDDGARLSAQTSEKREKLARESHHFSSETHKSDVKQHIFYM